MKDFDIKAEQLHLQKLEKILQLIIDCDLEGDVDGRKDVLIEEYKQLKNKYE